MAHILVTGGCGFIGTHLVRALLESGCRVTVIDDLSTGRADRLPAGARLVLADLAAMPDLPGLVGTVDAIVHLAAIASVERCTLEWRRSHDVNLSATVALFEAAAAAGRVPVIYASSAAVYGHGNGAQALEDDRPAPLSAYAADKLGCEHHAAVATLLHGVPTTGLRFFNVFGPGQDPASPYAGVITRFAACARAGEAIPLLGDGAQTRDFIHVSDVVRAISAALQRPAAEPRVINVCTGTATTIRSLAATVAEVCGEALELVQRPARAGDVRHSLGSPQRLKAELGVTAKVGLEEGLRQFLGSPAAPMAHPPQAFAAMAMQAGHR